MRTPRRHPRARRAGFTLLELMVALFVGSIVVIAVFSIGGASSRHFQEQQRVGVTQRSVRLAMDRLRRDIGRAGYMSVRDTRAGTGSTRMCRSPATPRVVQAVWFGDADSTGTTALATANGPANGVSADRLRLTGNYATDDGYLVRSFDATGEQVYLQTDWLAFRRAFYVDVGAGPVFDAQRFQDEFRVGRMLHIETPNQNHIITHITGTIVAGTLITIRINPGIGTDNDCLDGLGRGSIVAPISEVEYFIGTPPAGSNLAPRSPLVTGANTVLYRQELDMRTPTGPPLAGTRRAVLEYAVDFSLSFAIDTNLTATPTPNIALLPGPTAQPIVQNRSWQVRSIVASIAARTPEQDPRFGWQARAEGGPLNRYQVFPGREGAARVRQLTTEIQMPNLTPR